MDNEQNIQQVEEPVQSWTGVLESGLTQLGAGQPSIRLDAWRNMYQCVENHVRSSTFQPNLSLEQHTSLCKYAQRDVEDPQGKAPQYALKFLTSFMQRIGSESPPDAFARICDTSITALTKREMPKALVKCHLDFLTHQNFSSRVMTTTQVRRAVIAIEALELHSVAGIPMGRINVYRRILHQFPDDMALVASHWFPHLFSAMLSNETPMFKLAVDTAFEASKLIGHRPETTRAVERHLFAKGGNEDDRTNLDILCTDMEKKSDMATNITRAMYVPKMQASMLLLLRAKGPSVSLPNDYRRLLGVLKPYWSTRVDTATNAYTAWSWMIVAEMYRGRWPASTSEKVLHPIQSQLTKAKGSLDFSTGIPRYAASTYFTLLFCSFSSETPIEHMRQKWDLYVVNIINGMLSISPKHGVLACRILCTLFNSDAVWNPSHWVGKGINGFAQPLVELHELPRLDSKWVRSNLLSVLKLVYNAYHSQHGYEKSIPVWSALLDAVASAGSGEVVATKDTKQALAQIINHLTAVWDDVSNRTGDFNVYEQLLTPTIRGLGNTPDRLALFTDKFLTKIDKNGGFEVAPTPSHRSSNRALQSPILHILSLMLKSLSEGCTSTIHKTPAQALYNLILKTATTCFEDQPSKADKALFLFDFTKILTRAYKASSTPESYVQLDDLSACVIDWTVQTAMQDSPAPPSSRLGPIYEHLVSIMADMATHTAVSAHTLEECYIGVSKMARAELGLGGDFAALTEPSARRLHGFLEGVDQPGAEKVRSSLLVLVYAKVILRTASKPKNAKAMTDVLVKLGRSWSMSSVSPDFKELHPMTGLALQFGYNHVVGFEEGGADEFVRFLNTVENHLKDAKSIYYECMQKSMAIVIKDKQGKFFGPQGDRSCAQKVSFRARHPRSIG